MCWWFCRTKKYCDICYDEKRTTNIKCCNGKKWCDDCKKYIKMNFLTCPFCRTSFSFYLDHKKKYKHPLVRPYHGQFHLLH